MAIIENIINVLVPLLICGLIFIYFRRKITNLEQSIDIIMKMLQTNQLNGNETSNDNLFIPGNHDDTKTVEINNVNLEENDLTEHNEQSDDSESSSDESNTEGSDSDSSESSEHSHNSENLNTQPVEENTSGVTNIEELINNTEIINETPMVEETKTVLLSNELSKEELEKKTLSDLKKMLKDKVPDINNLSRMNKATVIENLMQ